jgi:hypothetical protein
MPPNPPTVPGPSRRCALAAWGMVVLVAHLVLIGPGLRASPGGGAPVLPVRPLPVHAIVRTRPVEAAPAKVADRPATAAAGQSQGRARPSSRPPSAIDPAPAHQAQAPPAPAAGVDPLPVYPTLLPPPLRLRYSVRRGEAQSEAELTWRPAPGRYSLSWRGAAANGQALGRDSQGALQGHGIEPERYTESRRGREQRAVNFQREAGQITFSGPQRRVPLSAGAQDRLSWMLQLSGVMAADPSLASPGRGVSMRVAGPGGDADVWQFSVQGGEPDAADAGMPGALHLRRQALRPYDTQVDIWLDPGRHHLPVRVLLRAHPDGAVSELILQETLGIP